MSLKSYRRNVERGVTGPYKPTCYPAALEQLSPYGLPSKTYKEYTEFISWYYLLRNGTREKYNPEFAEMMDNIVKHLGGLSCEEVIFKHGSTPLGVTRIIKQLLREDCTVAVDIRTSHGFHTVGLLPTGEEDLFTLVSNQIPSSLQGVVSLQTIANRVVNHPDRYIARYPFNNANITALPPID